MMISLDGNRIPEASLWIELALMFSSSASGIFDLLLSVKTLVCAFTSSIETVLLPPNLPPLSCVDMLAQFSTF